MHPGKLKMTGGRRVARSAAVICVALLGGGCVEREGARDVVPIAPTASVPGDEPSVSASAIARPLRDTGGEGILEPGTYVLDQFPVDLAFDIPDGDPPGWHVGMSTADAAIVLWFTRPDFTYGFAFWNADNIYVDPCDAAAGELEPPVGPSVDDLVAALSSQQAFQATAPVDVTVGAFPGKAIELTALDSGVDCPNVIAFSAGVEAVDLSSGQTLRAQILDVRSVRIVIVALEPGQWGAPSAPPIGAAEAELHEILDSIRIEPPS